MEAHDVVTFCFAGDRFIQRHHPRAAGYLCARVHNVSSTLASASPALASKPDCVIGDIAWCDLLTPGLCADQQGGSYCDGIASQFLLVFATNWGERRGE